jgi:hypothetical protein
MACICGLCGKRLAHLTGSDNRDDPDYRGNTIEDDLFECAGCGRRFRHVYRERFDGDSESWSVVEGGSERELERALWPK